MSTCPSRWRRRCPVITPLELSSRGVAAPDDSRGIPIRRAARRSGPLATCDLSPLCASATIRACRRAPACRPLAHSQGARRARRGRDQPSGVEMRPMRHVARRLERPMRARASSNSRRRDPLERRKNALRARASSPFSTSSSSSRSGRRTSTREEHAATLAIRQGQEATSRQAPETHVAQRAHRASRPGHAFVVQREIAVTEPVATTSATRRFHS